MRNHLHIQERVINGLTVVYCQMPFCWTVHIGFYCRAGSYLDTTYRPGIAHFLEHVMFKGTKNRTLAIMNKEVGRIGAYMNAMTHPFLTNYFLECPDDYLREGSDILFDMVLSPVFPAKEVEKERGVILEELAEYTNDPIQNFIIKAEKKIFTPQLGHFSIGDKRDIQDITVKEVQQFYRQCYGTRTMTLVIVGSLPPEQVFSVCEENLAKHKLMSASVTPIDRSMFVVDPSPYECVKRGAKQSYVLAYFPAPSMVVDDDSYFCVVEALGGDTTSLLFNEIREKAGLCYSISASRGYASPYKGNSQVFAICSPSNKEKVCTKIVECIRKLKSGKVSDTLLRNARALVYGEMCRCSNVPGRLCDIIGVRRLYGYSTDIEKRFDKVKMMRVEDIRECVQTWLPNEDEIRWASLMPHAFSWKGA